MCVRINRLRERLFSVSLVRAHTHTQLKTDTQVQFFVTQKAPVREKRTAQRKVRPQSDETCVQKQKANRQHHFILFS